MFKDVFHIKMKTLGKMSKKCHIWLTCEGKQLSEYFHFHYLTFQVHFLKILNVNPPSPSIQNPFFSALPKLSCGYKTDWGLGVTSLNRLPTGGEVAASAGERQLFPIAHSPRSRLFCRQFLKQGQSSTSLWKTDGKSTRRQLKRQVLADQWLLCH